MKLLILTQKIDINDDVLGFMHGWIKEFAEHCEKVTALCLYKSEYDLPKNVKVLSLGKEAGLSRLKYIFRFYKYIWQERKNYDNVFVHMNPEYVVLGGLFWRLWRKKISLWYTHKNVGLWLIFAEKITNIIFTASPKSFRLPSKKLKVMGHGIDTNLFAPSDSKIKNDFKIISVGRLSPVKDYETIINAMALVKPLYPGVRLEIYGVPGTREQYNYLEKLKNSVKKLNLNDSIVFAGSVPNRLLPRILQSADIFLNSSQTGSLDKAILEAMACGVLILTCNEAAVDDVLYNYKDVLFFEKKNSKMLSEKIQKLLLINDDRRAELLSVLRNIVVEKHNMRGLIKNIIYKLEK